MKNFFSKKSCKSIYYPFGFIFSIVLINTIANSEGNQPTSLSTTIDPITRYIHISYTVPAGTPGEKPSYAHGLLWTDNT
ncbi:MAG: hypothetical protein ACP5QY_15370 [Candidatus Hydrogenedens sp.]